MSVLIKGMEMPTSCYSCNFCQYYAEPNQGCYCLALFVDLHKTNFVKERLPNCPLIEVPTPHGRLIDAEVVEKEIERYEKISGYPVGEEPKEFTVDDGWETVRYTAWMARCFIAEQNAPTIIESEGE